MLNYQIIYLGGTLTMSPAVYVTLGFIVVIIGIYLLANYINKLESLHEWRQKMECSEPFDWESLLLDALIKRCLPKKRVINLFKARIDLILSRKDPFFKLEELDLLSLLALRRFITHLDMSMTELDKDKLLYINIVEGSANNLHKATSLRELTSMWDRIIRSAPEVEKDKRLNLEAYFKSLKEKFEPPPAL